MIDKHRAKKRPKSYCLPTSHSGVHEKNSIPYTLALCTVFTTIMSCGLLVIVHENVLTIYQSLANEYYYDSILYIALSCPPSVV